MEFDLSAVDGRKEITSDDNQHHSAKCDHQDDDCWNDEPVTKDYPKQSSICAAHLLEPAFERVMKAGKNVPGGSVGGAMMLAFEQQTNDDGSQCSRKCVGREHREHDGESERGEQELRGPFEEDDRGENAADRERRDQSRHRNAGGSV